jgi:7-cyano-7-deazaguanine synthase in queuosine biosynthesis
MNREHVAENWIEQVAETIVDHLAEIGGEIDNTENIERFVLDAAKEAWEEAKTELESNLIAAREEPCTCYSDPEGPCRHCNGWSRAFANAEAIFLTIKLEDK